MVYQKLVESGKCSEVFSMVYSLYEPGMALCFVRPTNEDEAIAIGNELLDLVERKASKLIDETQIERIKARALKRIKLSMANSKEMALKLSESIACGDWRLFFWYRDQLKKVSFEDVKRVATQYILPSNRTLGIFLPQKFPLRVTIERAEETGSLLKDIVEDPTLTVGESFLANAKNIESLIVKKQISALRSFAFLPKKTRGQSVRAHIRFRFGNAPALTPVIKEFWLIPSLLWRGTKKYDYQALRDRVDSLMSTLDIDGNAGILTSSIKSERQYLNEMVSLLSHIFSEPAFKPEEFAIVKQREIDNYEEIKTDPQRLGFQELERLKSPWPKGHILYVDSFDEIIDGLSRLSLDKIKESFHNLFSPENCSMAVVGDSDSEELLKAMHGSFLKTNKAVPFERIKRPFIGNVVKDVTLDTKDKEMAIIAYAFNFPMRDDHEDFPILKLANYMFGENMNSRLMNRIREKEGISYGAGSSIEISRYEENASLNIYAMAAPQSASRAKKAVLEEWMKILDTGFAEDELKKAKESIWLNFENTLGNDGFLVNAMAHDLETGRNFLWREKIYLRMKELSLSDINKALKTWWSGAQFSQVTAGDVSRIK